MELFSNMSYTSLDFLLWIVGVHPFFPRLSVCPYNSYLRFMRWLMEIAFKGTAYHGWQKQHNAHSVQTELERKLTLLLGGPVETVGCGRTDTGVHAKQFFLHFDCEKKFEPANLIHKLNQTLPKDIAVHRIKKVKDGFNARFDAKYREYDYCISIKPDPFSLDFAWQFSKQLDMDAMNSAAKILFEYEDFECFSKNRTQVKTYRCSIMKAQWKKKKGQLVFTIRADRFLRNMVRAIVGTMVEIGLGRLDEEGFRKIIESKSRSKAGQSVPAQGLSLVKVGY